MLAADAAGRSVVGLMHSLCCVVIVALWMTVTLTLHNHALTVHWRDDQLLRQRVGCGEEGAARRGVITSTTSVVAVETDGSAGDDTEQTDTDQRAHHVPDR